MQGTACMICSNTHYSCLCPELYASLKQGFYTGGGGGGGHSHDEDDEHIEETISSPLSTYSPKVKIEIYDVSNIEFLQLYNTVQAVSLCSY